MTSITLGQETIQFLYACLLGAGIGICYDAVRVFRILIHHHHIVVSIEDFFFCVVAAVVTFGFFLAYSKGEVRAYLLAGELAGVLVYFFGISSWMMKLLRPIAGLIHRILAFIFRPIFFVFRKIREIFQKLTKKTLNFTKKIARNAGLHLKKQS